MYLHCIIFRSSKDSQTLIHPHNFPMGLVGAGIINKVPVLLCEMKWLYRWWLWDTAWGLSCIKVDQGTSHSPLLFILQWFICGGWRSTEALFWVEFTVEVAKVSISCEKDCKILLLCAFWEITHSLSLKMC